MTHLSIHHRLLGSAATGICGVLAFVAFADSAKAQTACSQTGTAVTCVDGLTTIATGTVDATTVVTLKKS